ncbi:hypothetical protein FRAHR75_30047 [Frankia sp. Hr75.2]|nr:hypothetical protein FRAHR75_30047 [Frankia sp. Hr75.2]
MAVMPATPDVGWIKPESAIAERWRRRMSPGYPERTEITIHGTRGLDTNLSRSGPDRASGAGIPNWEWLAETNPLVGGSAAVRGGRRRVAGRLGCPGRRPQLRYALSLGAWVR